MKVLCIDASDREDDYECSDDFEIEEGKTYTVCDEFECKMGVPCYCLSEDPDREFSGFAKDRFIPVSDIDETKRKRKYNLLSYLIW